MTTKDNKKICFTVDVKANSHQMKQGLKKKKKKNYMLGTGGLVAHICNLSYLGESEIGRITV
jgi:hypothetical protein